MVCNVFFISHITSTASYSIHLPNGEVVSVTHIGTVKLNNSISLQNILCVPSFNFNLLSVRKFSEQIHYCLIFLPIHGCLIFLLTLCFVQDLTSWKTIGKGEIIQSLYYLQAKAVSPDEFAATLPKYSSSSTFLSQTDSATTDFSQFDLWHYRLGHPSLSRSKLIHDTIVTFPSSHHFICPLTKQRKLPFPDTHISSSLFGLVHVDLWDLFCYCI